MPVEPRYELQDLLRVMERLRDPESGCPWDLAQDFETIVPSTLEEVHELVEAIEQQDFPHVAEELGDVLFQVVFYSQLARERGLFDFGSVVQTLVEKLVRRHPHVFADGNIEGVVEGETSVEAVKASWESIKQAERHEREQLSILADVPLALPALSRAQKLQKRAATVGFDWTALPQVLDKLLEEAGEFVAAQAEGDTRREEELGDILFTCVNLARHAGIDAEAALRRANQRFESRFRAMESSAAEAGESLHAMDAQRLEQLWEAVKRGA